MCLIPYIRFRFIFVCFANTTAAPLNLFSQSETQGRERWRGVCKGVRCTRIYLIIQFKFLTNRTNLCSERVGMRDVRSASNDCHWRRWWLLLLLFYRLFASCVGKSSLSELVIVIFLFRRKANVWIKMFVWESVPTLKVAIVRTICIYYWNLSSNDVTVEKGE